MKSQDSLEPAMRLGDKSLMARGVTAASIADHLFVSYAWEDRVVADWLTLRLTAAGYRVWCDRFKMLGGERFPEHIDLAIKTQTFRMLGLLSNHSLHKTNPVNERTLALAIARERANDFYIPLDLEGLKATDLPWMVSSITFVPFTDWADGLKQLLKKLNSISAPKPLADRGTQAVIDVLKPEDIVLEKPEELFTNCFRFSRIPPVIRVYTHSSFVGPLPESFSAIWSFHVIDDERVASFTQPPQVHGFSFEEIGTCEWRSSAELHGTPVRHIVTNLLRQAVRLKLLQSGLCEDRASGIMYFPRPDAHTEAKLSFVPPVGRTEDLQATGKRRFGADTYRYYLAPAFRIRTDIGADFWAQLTARVFITDWNGSPLDSPTAFVRRKHLTKSWFNHQWLTRQLAVMQHLACGADTIRIGAGDDLIEIEARPLSGIVPQSINDAALKPLRRNAAPVTDAIDDTGGVEENEGEDDGE